MALLAGGGGLLGTPFWGHSDRVTYLYWLRDFGMEVAWDRLVSEGVGGHVVVLARKPQ